MYVENLKALFSGLIIWILGRYLNTQHIRKSKLGDAEMRFVDSAMQQVEQMEIGELGLLSFYCPNFASYLFHLIRTLRVEG